MATIPPINPTFVREATQALKKIVSEATTQVEPNITPLTTQEIDSFHKAAQDGIEKVKGATTKTTEETTKKNIFQKGWGGVKTVFGKIWSIIKWPFSQLKSLFSKSSEKESKTGKTTTTEGDGTEQKPPADKKEQEKSSEAAA